MAAGSDRLVLTINGGSSSIKYGVFGTSPVARVFSGAVERIGLAGATFTTRAAVSGAPLQQVQGELATPQEAAARIVQFLREEIGNEKIAGVGHRIVHGGLHLFESQVITPAVLAALEEARPLDPTHLPAEIGLVKTFQAAFPGVPHVASFDTAFHHGMPRVAQLLPIPRKDLDGGLRRFGFHGLSYTYLLGELGRLGGAKAAAGKCVLAHLGSGASMAAVEGGRPIDTTMAFTPAAGLVMGTRPGDIDAGLLTYLQRRDKLSSEELDEFINRRCGLLGVSGSSSDMRDLLARCGEDGRAAEALELFCYQASKWIAALAAAMNGIDTLVFSAGIGEHSPEVRARICSRSTFLGIEVEPSLNAGNAAIISPAGGRVVVRIIPTDEEIVIARNTMDALA